MRIAQHWKDYEIIASGDGQKLERWGNVILLRPDPQAIWRAAFDLSNYKGINAIYRRHSSGGGKWEILKSFPESWVIRYKDLAFYVSPTGFKHTGLFPEQAVNWDIMRQLIEQTNRKDIKVLNLFAYTGAASIACAASGAKVTHIDAAKGMVDKAKANAVLNKITDIRFIVEDCAKFVEREQRRGNQYDAILMDPPSYGRGPNGEMWKIENNIDALVFECAKILVDNPLFFLINSYTTGLQPSVMNNIIKRNLKDKKGRVISYEVTLPTNEDIVMPCGASAIFIGEGYGNNI